MPIPISYSYRNLLARRLTTFLTAAGMALVVFVFAAVLMLSEGLRRTLVATGSFDNVVVLRAGSESEVQSAIDRTQAGIIGAQPEVALDKEGRRLVADEAIVLINLPKRGSGMPGNVIIRGVQPVSPELRREVHLSAGRFLKPGSTEIVAGAQIARRFQGAGLGETLRFAMRQWRVVGVMDAGNTGFSSELWGDMETLLAAFRRTAFSSVILRLRDPAAFDALKARLEKDPRLPVQVLREVEFYENQSRRLATFIRILGLVLTGIFGLGAILGAMVTMYAQVGARIAEIGTLQGPGVQAASHPGRLPPGVHVPGVPGMAPGPGAGLAVELLYALHHQLVELRRDHLQVRPDPGDHRQKPPLRRGHGPGGGLSALPQGGPSAAPGGPAGGLIPGSVSKERKRWGAPACAFNLRADTWVRPYKRYISWMSEA